MFNRRTSIISRLLSVAAVGMAGLAQGSPGEIMTEAAKHRSTRAWNGGQGRGAVARSKRAARKRNNIRKHARG